MGFFTDLGSAISNQLGYGENQVSSLDSDTGDYSADYGKLGDFSKKFDRSAERSYIEDGFVRNIRPRLREVIHQQPDITVVFKKRIFSSLKENFRPDLLEEKEKLFIRASKKLIQNKCKLIASYERLTKIEQVTRESGQFNTNLLPAVSDAVNAIKNLGGAFMSSREMSDLERIRKMVSLAESSGFSNYVTYNDSPFVSSVGEGDGVFELTTIASLTTSVSNEFSGGKASLTIEDPYKFLIVTDDDIETALSDATNFFTQNPFFVLSQNQLEQQIQALIDELNSTRMARGASQIKFIVNSETVISKKVRAIIDATGKEINFNYNSGLVGIGGSVDLWTEVNENPKDAFEALDGRDPNTSGVPKAFRGLPAFQNSEKDLFKQIIRNYYLMMGQQTTTNQRVSEFNQDANHARLKMRRFFADLPIIQPVDVVNIFLTTRTTEDVRLTQGFNSIGMGGFRIGQTFDRLLNSITTTFNNIKGGSSDIDHLEKNAIVGPGFPMWLWRQVRNDVTKQGAGTAIFIGLVTSVSSNYSNGKYILSVDCEDNSGYFNKSQINFKPALDVFNQELYDPLTPFDISFDASTGVPITDINQGNVPPLLPENIKLLRSRSARYNSGTNKGQKTSTDTYLNTPDGEVSADNAFRSIMSNPNGMVYRWKQGIQSLTKIERAFPNSGERRETSPLLTKNPFAGQDVMNVLSLLVTGQPYSYNSFLKAAVSNANTLSSTNPLENRDLSTSYLDGLLDDLRRRNVVWGSFVPFKQLTINEDADAFIRSGQADFLKNNNEIRQLRKRAANILDQLALMGAEYANNSDPIGTDGDGQISPVTSGSTATTVEEERLKTELANINAELRDKWSNFQNTVENLYSGNFGGNISIYGDDLALNPNINEGQNSISEADRKLSRREFRRKIGFLTLRRLWQVKGNEDRNLFVVDDQYDRSYDIQAFERKIGAALNIFSSEFTTVDDQIRNVAKLLGLEIFADSQGHIRVRPPLYNRVPSSVFYRMMRDRTRKGYRIFPEFLESLYFNQIEGQINAIEIAEDKLRLYAVALGVNNSNGDGEVEKYLAGPHSVGGVGFKFLSSYDTGKIDRQPLQSAIEQARPDKQEEFNSNPLKDYSNNITNKISNRRVFDQTARSTQGIIRRNRKKILSQETSDRLFEIRRRLLLQQGVEAPTFKQLFSDERFSKVNGGLSELDALKINEEISRVIAERQQLVQSFANTIRNLGEGLSINADGSDSSKAALTPFLNRSQEIPEILEHMIEDEDEHDLGPNSGNRFILNDKNIISYNISENPPDYTLVQVNSLFGEGGFLDPPASLATSAGGNVVTSAYAVDYFTWEKYGFRATNSVEAPFFTDPASQCAPLAVFLLNLARQNIIQGTVSINGYNEYYQVGDVVYLEDRDLLFYVTQVNHSFSYGDLNTSLTLKYGHKPGEYIPTILDIVGKILYQSQGLLGGYRNSKKTSINGEESLGVIIFDDTDAGIALNASYEQALLKGRQGRRNQKVLSSIFLGATGLVNPASHKKQKPVITIRYYYLPELGVSPYLPEAAESLKKLLANPQKEDQNSLIMISDSDNNESGLFKFNADDVIIEEINVDDDFTVVSPSDAAWNVARALESERYASDYLADEGPNQPTRLEKVLFNSCLDVWLTFNDIEETEESAINLGGGTLSQFEQETNESLGLASDAAKNAIEE